jgi:SnoaL-like domain
MRRTIMLEEFDLRCRANAGERRIMCAAIALGAATLLSAGFAPIAHAAPAIPTSSAVSTLANVVDADAEIEALKQLKATYFRDVDSKQWLALREHFIPGAQVDTTGSLGPYFPNRELFVAFTAFTLSAINTRHKGYDPQIELTSDSTANGVWTMQDRLSLAGLVTIHGYGHYIDTYEKVDGKWVVTSSKLTRSGFGLEFPALEHFVTGFGEVLKSQGPVAALQYAVTAIVNIPLDAAMSLAGAVLSNFGGPPAKAEEIKLPPGSQDETNPEPSSAPIAAATTFSSRSVAVAGPALTRDWAGVDATPPVTAPVVDALRDTAGPADQHAQSVESGAAQLADDDKSGANTVGSTAESPKPDNALNSADPKHSTEAKKSGDTGDSTEAKKPGDLKHSTESRPATAAPPRPGGHRPHDNVVQVPRFTLKP